MSADAQAIVTERNVSKASGLLHSLVPRAQVFCYYDRKKKCVWNSDGAEDYEIARFVAELPQEIVEKLDCKISFEQLESVINLLAEV